MKKIYFLRHGETEEDVNSLYSGPNSKLSALGIRQVESAAHKLHRANISKIFSSKYNRAVESAKIVAEFSDKEIEILDFIHEKEVPDKIICKSRKSLEFENYYEQYKKEWLRDSLDSKEGLSSFVCRVDQLINFILDLPDNKNYLFVSHDVFIRTFFFRVVFGEDFNSKTFISLYNKTRSDFASISEFIVENGDILAKQFADSSHLRQIKTLKKVVSIGGGTGQYTLLKALRQLPLHISAIVSVADDGGSAGVLRDELGVLPPSDIRKCIIALSDAEPSLRKLFSYRFSNPSFKGHSLGNLILSSLEKINDSSIKATKEATKIFMCKGEVIPVSEATDMRIKIKLKNEEVLDGEYLLDDNWKVRQYGVKEIYLKNKVEISDAARKEIENAEYIIIGPGDLYGSLIPNFLVSGMKDAIANSKAKIIYVANLTNKKGQTDKFSLCNYMEIIQKYTGRKIDYALCNVADIDQTALEKYIMQEGDGAVVDCHECKERNLKVIKVDLLNSKLILPEKGDTLASSRSYIRHDPDKLASAIARIIKVSK